MIHAGEQFKDSIRDVRVVYDNRESVKDVTCHPRFKPQAGIGARIYDMRHEAGSRNLMTIGQEALKCLESQKRMQK